MIKVYTSSVIDAPAEAVWARVRDFNGLPQWTPFVADSRIEEGQPADRIGCVRNFRLRDGGVIRERLLTLSDYDYQCSYAILESPMGVENYVATLKLTVGGALAAAAAHRVGLPARRGRAAVPAAPCPVEPRVLPLFPPLPDVPDAADAAGHRPGRGERLKLPPEGVVGLLGQLRFRTSYGQNVLDHLVETANLAAIMADELGASVETARRAALLHDIGKAVTHEVEGSHAIIGAEIARRMKESPEVVHCIESHHGEVEQRTIEAVIAQIADGISGGRPGARRESLETYIKRL